jgi:hypothetical protein
VCFALKRLRGLGVEGEGWFGGVVETVKAEAAPPHSKVGAARHGQGALQTKVVTAAVESEVKICTGGCRFGGGAFD